MRIAAMLTALALVGTACDGASSASTDGGITSDQFIDVYVNLMRAQNLVGPSPDFEQRKQKVLKDAGVTEETLKRFVQEHADEISMMAAMWDTIQTRIARISNTTATME